MQPFALRLGQASPDSGTPGRRDPPTRSVLERLHMPRWYLVGAVGDPEDLVPGLAALGVGWKVVPDPGHPMGLQNPAGFAQAVAEAAAAAWPP